MELDPKDVAVQGMFLFAGFALGGYLSETGMGQVEAASYCAPWAVFLARVLDELDGRDFPGVFEHEITEDFGAYLLASYDSHRTREQLLAYLWVEIALFFDRGGEPLTPEEARRIDLECIRFLKEPH